VPDGVACAGRILAERDGMFRRNRWYNPRSVGDDPICPRVYNMHERTVRQRMMVNAIGGTDCTGAHLLGQPGWAGYTKTSLVYVEECFGRHAAMISCASGPKVTRNDGGGNGACCRKANVPMKAKNIRVWVGGRMFEAGGVARVSESCDVDVCTPGGFGQPQWRLSNFGYVLYSTSTGTAVLIQ
jgi:hypothetical protein